MEIVSGFFKPEFLDKIKDFPEPLYQTLLEEVKKKKTSSKKSEIEILASLCHYEVRNINKVVEKRKDLSSNIFTYALFMFVREIYLSVVAEAETENHSLAEEVINAERKKSGDLQMEIFFNNLSK